MILYFSGTGNSRYAATLLARQLEDTLVDTGAWIKENKRGVFHSEHPWVIVAPTYAWQLPHVLRDFLGQATFTGSREAYFVMTCGGDIGNSGQGLQALCQALGLTYRGVLELVMPENYVVLTSCPEEGEARAILAKAPPALEAAAAQIKAGKPFPGKPITGLDRLKSSLVNRAFYRVFIGAKAFYTTEACTGCGQCEKACPLNNIHLVEKQPRWGAACTHCMACICGCPTQAIEYGKRSRGRVRYRCPEDLL